MKWIKASERLPIRSGCYFAREVKNHNCKKILFFSYHSNGHLKTQSHRYEWLDEAISEPVDITDNGQTFFAR